MIKRVFRWICLAALLIVLVMALAKICKCMNRVRYIEDAFGVEIADMIEEIDGSITPGFGVLGRDTIQLKVTVNEKDKTDFFQMLSANFFSETDHEQRILLLMQDVNDNYAKYMEEIKASEIRGCFIDCVKNDYWGRPVDVVVTEQEGKMIVYFMEAY